MSYVRVTTEDLLSQYMKAVDNLTINEENRLRRKVEKLEEEQNEVAQMRLKHEREMKEMREEMQTKFSQILDKIDLKKID